MKVIFTDLITALTATSEDANYDVEFAQNERKRIPWRATSGTNTATVKATVSAGSDCCFITGTNAGQVDITIKNLAETVTIYGPTEYDLREVDTLYEFMTDDAEDWDTVWGEYPQQGSSHKVIMDFTAPSGTTLEAGIIRCGQMDDFSNSDYSLSESYEDYSIIGELSSGSADITEKPLARLFTGTVRSESDNALYDFLDEFVETIGVKPLPWLITDLNDKLWAVYARMRVLPTAEYNEDDRPLFDFEILETV